MKHSGELPKTKTKQIFNNWLLKLVHKFWNYWQFYIIIKLKLLSLNVYSLFLNISVFIYSYQLREKFEICQRRHLEWIFWRFCKNFLLNLEEFLFLKEFLLEVLLFDFLLNLEEFLLELCGIIILEHFDIVVLEQFHTFALVPV